MKIQIWNWIRRRTTVERKTVVTSDVGAGVGAKASAAETDGGDVRRHRRHHLQRVIFIIIASSTCRHLCRRVVPSIGGGRCDLGVCISTMKSNGRGVPSICRCLAPVT
ncbi:hypothetical protein HanIR_Chr03g0108571 [Helianthus annuus]|nr:hypothetical protein HanIR_Chr03g0108571 [Helianthus annuus]